MNCGHEFKVVGAEGAGLPIARIGWVAHWLAASINPDPVRMRVVHLLPASVSVSARNHVHSHGAAAGQQVAKGVAIAKPRAALLQGKLCGVERDHTAGTEAGGVGMDAAEVVEPELLVIVGLF